MSSQSANESVKSEMNGAKSCEVEINLFGPKDSRAPLPGNIGIASFDHTVRTNLVVSDSKTMSSKEALEMICLNDIESRQQKVIDQIEGMHDNDNDDESSSNPIVSHSLECVAHNCPQLMIKDFCQLFPVTSYTRPDLLNNLTVVTLCQKTENDMSEWNQLVDSEREQMIRAFISIAKCICDYLKKVGYWADFIDPSSGRPYFVSDLTYSVKQINI